MRSSQRCSESFSCEEKYRRTSRLTFPFAAGDGFSAGGALALEEAALPLAFSAAFPLDFSRRALFATSPGSECVSAAAPSGRASLGFNFLSKAKARLQPSQLGPRRC